ncbi:MAG: DUF6132 family protein [Bacteroidales bacterium]
MSNMTRRVVMVKVFKYLKNKKVLFPVLGAVTGGGLGFAYYYFVGCNGGSCPITGSPWGSITFGSLLGLVLTVK